MSALPFHRRKDVRLAMRYCGMLLVVIFVFPVYWLFIISFKTPDEILHSRRSGIPRASSSPTTWCCSRMATRKPCSTA